MILQGTLISQKTSNLKVESILLFSFAIVLIYRLDIGLDEIVKCVAEAIEHPAPGQTDGQSCRGCSFLLLPAKPLTEPSKLIQVSGQPQGSSGLGLWDDKRWSAEINN